MAKTRVFTVEANIGAGKSTLLQALAGEGELRLTTLLEPIEAWTSPVPGTTAGMLEHFYADPGRHAASFQIHVLKTRLDQLLDLDPSPDTRPDAIVTERSIWSDHAVFGAMQREAGLISPVDWHTYSGWVDTALTVAAARAFALSGVVYLRTSPEVCHARLTRRARAGEHAVTLDYLRRVHGVHEAWTAAQAAAGVPVLVLDGDAEWNQPQLAAAVRALVASEQCSQQHEQ
jgi:deoxyadenosine/deoxycytidine kinase